MKDQVVFMQAAAILALTYRPQVELQTISRDEDVPLDWEHQACQGCHSASSQRVDSGAKDPVPAQAI